MMNRMLTIVSMVLVIFFTTASSQADVKKESTTKMEFKGALGTIMKFFGSGKPTSTSEYYKGNVYKSETMDDKGRVTNSQIVDLDQELFISIDHKKKQYTQMTFDEWRKMMEENIQKMEKEQKKAKDDDTKVEWDFKVDVEKPGDTEMIAGKNAEKVIVKLEVTSKATQEDAETSQAQTMQGDMIVTSTNWMVSDVKGQKEIEDFHKKMAEKIGFLPGKGGMEDMMARINQSNPKLAEAIEKMQKESQKLSGVPFRTETVYETSGAATSADNQQEMETKREIPTSVGGLLKGFGKKMAKPDKEDESNQNVLMQTTTEVTEFEVAPIDSKEFEVPANYKLRNK